MFTTYFIQPVYNVFVFLIGMMPGGDVGLAIIALTIIVRIVLYPVFTASIRTQMGMQAMQADLDVATKKFKDKPEELTAARLGLLKKHKVNPLAGIGTLVIQLVVLISLYYAMFREGFPAIEESLLYPFVHAPAVVSTNFFGLLDLFSPHHIVLAVLVGLTQYFTIRLTLARTNASQGSLSPEKAAAQRLQSGMMLYAMPALLTVFGYFFPAAVGLYFITGNVLSLGQEALIKRELQK
ncbi:MAG: YidC/Oxa1 family membrane protein insertase [Patescibacteria group bacterium]